MTPKDLKRWRKSLELSQKEAAHALGLKRRVIQYYEKGERDGGELEIPLYVRLACYALSEGVTDYAGPPEDDGRAAKPARKAAKAAAKDRKGSRRLIAEPEAEMAGTVDPAATEAPGTRAAETLLPDPLADPVPPPATDEAAAPAPRRATRRATEMTAQAGKLAGAKAGTAAGKRAGAKAVRRK